MIEATEIAKITIMENPATKKEATRIAERQDFLCGIACPIADRVFFDSGVSVSHDCLDWNDDDLAIAIRVFMESIAFDLG